MSMPFGMYCISSLLVFSLLPRCQGLWGSQEVDLDGGCHLESLVTVHLRASIPG